MKQPFKLQLIIPLFAIVAITFLHFQALLSTENENHSDSIVFKTNAISHNKKADDIVYWFSEQETLNGSLIYSTIYGDFLIDEPVIIELIKSAEMQRLKEINQYGIDYYVYKPQIYTRFQHSIAVYLLTKKYGASIQEQIAALLHDVSHTIFSHTGDFLLKEDCRVDAYQDDIHDLSLQNSSIKGILEKYNFTTKQIGHKNNEFIILDQPSPSLCADRIEYNLYGGYIEGILSLSEIKMILTDLKFENSLWYFDAIYSARLLSYSALFLTDTRFAGFNNFGRNCLFSQILERALEINIVTFEDIHSSTDDIIWNRLKNCNDALIQSKLIKLYDIANFYELNQQHYDIFIYPKFRALDPLIKTEIGLLKLTEVDKSFKIDFEELKARIAVGMRIKFKD